MATEKETIRLEVTGTPELIMKFKRLMALLDTAGAVGHSGIFGMPLDGDGPDRLEIDVQSPDGDFNGLELQQFAGGVDEVGGVGYDVELANFDGFSGLFRDRKRNEKWFYDDKGRDLS